MDYTHCKSRLYSSAEFLHRYIYLLFIFNNLNMEIKPLSSQEILNASIKFYIEPSLKVFEELRELAIKEVWKKYDDTYKYATNKIDYINWFKNLSSNFMTIWQMCDVVNQWKIWDKASNRLKKAIIERWGFV